MDPYSEAAMKSKSLFGAAIALLFITAGANAGTVPLDVTTNYDFQLAGGGGGAEATLNGVPVQIYCDNFANEISLGSDYTAYVTPLSTSATLNDTRFGAVSESTSTTTGTGWEPILLTDGNSVDSADDALFNTGAGLAPLARYEMAAYLVSQYNLANNTTTLQNDNNEIQEAIWTLMDPTADGPVIDPSGLSPDSYLEQAASWYVGMNTPGNIAALNAFLAHFEVVSDASMTFPSQGPAGAGFQEQIVDPNPVPAPTPTPEPRGAVLTLGGLFAMAAGFANRARQARIHATS
jgi:hypothetical protein